MELLAWRAQEIGWHALTAHMTAATTASFKVMSGTLAG